MFAPVFSLSSSAGIPCSPADTNHFQSFMRLYQEKEMLTKPALGTESSGAQQKRAPTDPSRRKCWKDWAAHRISQKDAEQCRGNSRYKGAASSTDKTPRQTRGADDLEVPALPPEAPLRRGCSCRHHRTPGPGGHSGSFPSQSPAPESVWQAELRPSAELSGQEDWEVITWFFQFPPGALCPPPIFTEGGVLPTQEEASGRKDS